MSLALRTLLLAALLAALSCATRIHLSSYRMKGSTDWMVVGSDEIFEDVRGGYPEFFERVLDPADTRDLDLRRLRDDLERVPVVRRNFDALNAIAIAYFELNSRAEAERGGRGYLGSSFQTAKLAAVPWSAYGRVEDAALREAILDFFEDAAVGGKLASAATAPRLLRTVASLERKETDAGRLDRIRGIVEALEASSPQ